MQLNINESKSTLSIMNFPLNKHESTSSKIDVGFSDENINLKYISNDDLLFRTENLVQTERKIMHLVLTHILEIMNRRLYADLGFDSMYTMMIRKYGYSESSALRRIDAAKLLRTVPEVADRLKSGTLNLSQAVQLQKCLESEAKKGEVVSEARTQEILESLKNYNGFETRQVLAQEFEMPVKIQEIVRPQKDESVRLEITFTKEQFEALKLAKSFVSHIAHSGSWAEVISVLASKLNQTKLGKQNKPICQLSKKSELKNRDSNKSKLCKNRTPKSHQPVQNENPYLCQSEAGLGSSLVSKSGLALDSDSNAKLGLGASTESRVTSSTEVGIHNLSEISLLSSHPKRAPISVHLKRKVFAEAQGCCQYQSPDGIRCGSRFQVQIDHITPVAWRGSNSLDNLRLLCRAHNLLMSQKMKLH